MIQKTILKLAIEMIEQQRKALNEMNILGVLHVNEYIHKSNQITSIQIMLAKLIPIEEAQMIEFHINVTKLNPNLIPTPINETEIKNIAEQYYNETFI